MSKLIIITQKIDEDDDHRGFFIDWVKEYSKAFDTVSVITVAEGTHTLTSNVRVYSLGKELGASKFKQTILFYRYLLKLLPGSSGIFAHASAIFVIASWPFTIIFRKKIVLWYLHGSVTSRLKLAERLCHKIVTAAKESLGFRSSKLVETGHGINFELFQVERNWQTDIVNIISVGRITPIKRLETLIRSISMLPENLGTRLSIIGRPVMPPDHQYLSEIKGLVSDLGLTDRVDFEGFVKYKDMPMIYKKADMSVNLLAKGGLDKAVLESMASGLLVLTSNEVFLRYFGPYSDLLIFEHNDPSDLADKIKRLASLPAEEKDTISKFFVKSVQENHSLTKTIRQISDLFLK